MVFILTKKEATAWRRLENALIKQRFNSDWEYQRTTIVNREQLAVLCHAIRRHMPTEIANSYSTKRPSAYKDGKVKT